MVKAGSQVGKVHEKPEVRALAGELVVAARAAPPAKRSARLASAIQAPPRAGSDRPQRGSGARKAYTEPSSDESDSEGEGERGSESGEEGGWGGHPSGRRPFPYMPTK